MLVLAAGAVVYLNVHGFPPFLKRIVADQLSRYGYAMQFGNIRLDLLRGVVATDAVFADAKEPDQTLATVDEVQLVWNWRRLLNQQNPLDAIRIANGTMSVPTPPDEIGPSQFTALQAYATMKFEDDGTIQIDQLTGLYCGIALRVTGRVKPRAATPTEAQRKAEAGRSPFTFVTKSLRQLNTLRISTPPQLDVDFDLDLARPLDGKVKARLHGADFGYRKLQVVSATVDVEMHDGVIVVPQCLLALAGGELSVHGRYDFAMGGFDLHLESTVDPTALAPALPADVAKVLAELHVSEPPKITARYVLSPETGSLPELSGTVETGALEFRTVAFRAIQFAFRNHGPEVKVWAAKFVTPDGQLTGHGQYHIESSDFSYELDSTLDPQHLLPVMTPVMRQFVEPSWFETPPHIVASVRGDFVDPDAFAYNAQVDAKHCSYRGVRLESASAKLQLRHSRLDVRDLVLAREEGELRGALLADFNNHRVSFDIQTTANPTAMAPLLGPKAAQTMSAYRFGPHTEAKAHGMVDLDESTNSAWTAQVANDGFSYWKLTADHAAATLTFTNDNMRIDGFDADICGGKLRGTAAFAMTNSVAYQFDFNAEHCDVHKILAAIRGKESQVSGTVSGHCQLIGLGSDLATLRGNGDLEITDGVLWEMPLFGIFSHIMDGISPGLGQTKATNAKGTFAIENQRAKTDDLHVAAGLFTLQNHGWVGFDGKLDFRVQAQFMRAVPLINIPGWFIGKIFEYKVGGTLGDYKYRPVNFPKELLPHSPTDPKSN